MLTECQIVKAENYSYYFSDFPFYIVLALFLAQTSNEILNLPLTNGKIIHKFLGI